MNEPLEKECVHDWVGLSDFSYEDWNWKWCKKCGCAMGVLIDISQEPSQKRSTGLYVPERQMKFTDGGSGV
jgi:hypothetical protein